MKRSLPQPVPGLPMLTSTAEYALRALSELAALRGDEALRSADLSARTGVPEAYLSKVLRRLVEHGVLSARKGHGGGFSLSRPAHRIKFSDVLTALDSMPTSNRCAFGRPRCSSANPCPLHPAWSKLSDAFLQWARTTTLADIARESPGAP